MDAKMNLMKHTTKRSIVNAQVIEFAKENTLRMELPENSRIFVKSIDYFITSNDDIVDGTDGENILISGIQKYKLSESNFSGVHNAMNILACTIVADELAIPTERTKEYLSSITGLPHRLELIATKG